MGLICLPPSFNLFSLYFYPLPTHSCTKSIKKSRVRIETTPLMRRGRIIRPRKETRPWESGNYESVSKWLWGFLLKPGFFGVKWIKTQKQVWLSTKWEFHNLSFRMEWQSSLKELFEDYCGRGLKRRTGAKLLVGQHTHFCNFFGRSIRA